MTSAMDYENKYERGAKTARKEKEYKRNVNANSTGNENNKK